MRGVFRQLLADLIDLILGVFLFTGDTALELADPLQRAVGVVLHRVTSYHLCCGQPTSILRVQSCCRRERVLRS
jgi:hypothetical protein